MAANPMQILHVEDNPGDVLMTREALDVAGIPASVRIVTTGDEALDFLRRRGPYTREARPDLVILDLNLPVRSGKELLADMGNDPELCGIIVAILTSSPNDADVCSCYDKTLCRYFQKRSTFEGLVEVVKEIDAFWKLASRQGKY